MKSKECKIVCSGKDVATVNCTKNGCNIEYTEYGKKLSKEKIIIYISNH